MTHRRFSRKLLKWFDDNGRKDLPWQINKTPYRIWVSEIMLQQTQVKTVIPYFKRFVERFPEVADLAGAPLEEVMKCWAGLGYYSRAKNLHRSAVHICKEHGGELPRDFDALIALPGIGRSTAGAILALCHEKPFAILDGNAKRVLARKYGIEDWPGKSAIARKLWNLSEELLPERRISDYTQALMDLGAMICLRASPRCESCPIEQDCEARRRSITDKCPGRRPVKAKPSNSTVMLIVTYGNEVILQRRPDTGIWSNLLSFPEIDDIDDGETWCRRQLGITGDISKWPAVNHEFTHFKLTITPLRIRLQTSPQAVRENNPLIWYKISEEQAVPAPVRRLLRRLKSEPEWKTA